MLCGIGNENFKHGIEIITIADYFSLGNRVHSYLSIAPTVALFDSDLLVALKDHLISVKLAHWDTDIRLEIVVVYVSLVVLCCRALCYDVSCSVEFAYFVLLWCDELWCDVMYCIVLYCSLLCCDELWCDVLYCSFLCCDKLWYDEMLYFMS